MGRWLVVVLLAGCAAPEPGVEVSAFSFGVVEPDVPHHGELRLLNSGTRAAKLVRVERRAGPDVFTVTPGPIELAPGARARWRVSFQSAQPGLASARFAAVFDTGVAEFTVRARAAPPCAAEDFDVGDARVGHSVSRTFTVRNPLDEPAEVFVEPVAPPFAVEPSGTLRLGAGGSREVTVRFSPGVAGTPAVSWVVRPSADCTDTTVRLTGRALESSLSLAPGRLDFGALSSGASRSRRVGLSNHTRAEVNVTSLRLSSSAFRSATSLPLVVPAEGVVELEVEAVAPDAQPFDGVLTLSTSAVDQPEVSLPLLANRAAPCVTVSRERIDFSGVEVGCRGRDERVQFANDCPHEIGLGEVSVSSGFALISSPAPGRLAPGEAVQLAVSSAPAGEGASSGRLQVSADVLDGTQSVSVALTGFGTPTVVLSESRTVSRLPVMLDVVLVIDDSPKMLPMAASVQRNLETHARFLRANQRDARVGVMSTSTAPGELGRLRRAADGSAFLTNPTPAALAALGEVRGLSTSRSSCLETLFAAFTARDPAELGGLLRPGVELSVVCITNGTDALEVAPLPVISSLLSQLPRPYSFGLVARLTTLVPPLTDCGGERESGPLQALTQLTNGVQAEICEPDWALSLENFLGRTAFGYGDWFYLQQRPAFTRAPLRLWVDDVELPPVDPEPNLRSTIWEYQSEANAVVFSPLYAPEPGRTVRAQYTPECAP